MCVTGKGVRHIGELASPTYIPIDLLSSHKPLAGLTQPRVIEKVRPIVTDANKDISDEKAVELLRAALAEAPSGRRARIIEKFVLAALGSIPWVGGFVSAAAALRSEEEASQANTIQTKWLEEHEQKLVSLYATLNEIISRFESIGPQIDERIESPEYLVLVRKAFRSWDHADTEEKRSAVRNLICNSAGTRVCSDDVVRLFIDWLNLYHEAHLAVVRFIYTNPGPTRYDIWTSIWGAIPREDSAEADLYRYLIRDLSTGGVIRQARETDALGRFKRRSTGGRRPSSSGTMESSFEDTKQYVLTELGSQFVHYAMTEVTKRLEGTRNDTET